MIDKDLSYTGLFKFLSPKRLASLLTAIPEDYVVTCNNVGNIAIWKKYSDGYVFKGYINFLHEGEINWS